MLIFWSYIILLTAIMLCAFILIGALPIFNYFWLGDTKETSGTIQPTIFLIFPHLSGNHI